MTIGIGEGFEYPYQRIATTLYIGTANVRQLVRRARTRLAAGWCQPRTQAANNRFVRAFAAAWVVGEMTGLEAVLAADLRRAG